MFGSFGTPGNFAVRSYLNERQIPQLFIASGDDHLSDPSLFPWTMGWQPSFREEGRVYANYIQAFYPGSRIVALWQNDQVGREIFKGLEDGLDNVARIDLEAIRSRDFFICRSACKRSESNPNSGGVELAPCVHFEPYGFIDCDGAKACWRAKWWGRDYTRL